MIEILKDLYLFAKDKSTSIGLKSAIFITAIGLLFIVDYNFNLSYNYYINNKTEQLINLNKLENIYKNDSNEFDRLSKIEKRVLNQKHYSEYLEQLSIKDLFHSNASYILEESGRAERDTEVNREEPVRSLFWMILTSNYFFILLIIVLFILPFRGSVHRETKNLLGSIAAVIILIGIMSFITWIAYQIPIIYNRPYLNYILNIILHSPFLYILYATGSKKTKN